MTTRLFYLALVAITGVAACHSTPPVERRFAEARLYSRQLFSTPEACAAAQAQGVNCSQDAWFCPSGRAVLMLTDILHVGSYAIRHDTLSINFPPSPETPAVVTFLLASDEASLTEVPMLRTWPRDLARAGEAVEMCQ